MSVSKILGSKVDVLSRPEIQNKLQEYLNSSVGHFVVTSNVEMYYQAYLDPTLREVINQADLAIPDSVGIVATLRLQGQKQAELYPGIEICSWLLEQKLPVYIVGARQEVLDKFNLPNFIGKQHGYFTEKDEERIIIDIQQKKPKVLLVALGAGKQERWIAKYKKILNVPVMIGVGGAIDVLSGAKVRAPLFIRKLNLEWLYRLYKEPVRIVRQINLLKYVWAVLKEKFYARD